MDARSGHTRRRCLSALSVLAGTATAAGCLSWEQTGATDVVAYSLAPGDVTASITITESDADEPHTSRTFTLGQGEQIDPVNDSKLPTNTSYTVEVAVEEGASATFDWADPDIERAPLYVAIEDPQTVEFLYHAG